MKIAWFTPFQKESAIGKVSRDICEYLGREHEITIYTFSGQPLIDTEQRVVECMPEDDFKSLDAYDYIIYNMGNYAGNHKEILDVSLAYSGIVILHDQTMSSFWGQYYTMPEFGAGEDGILEYKRLMQKYYGVRAVSEVEKAEKDGVYPIFTGGNILDRSLIGPVVENATGVFTHASFFAQEVKEIYNGPVSFSYLPCTLPACETDGQPDEDVEEFIRKTREEGRLLLVSTGIVHPVKNIDKVCEVLCSNPELKEKFNYLVLGSYGGEYAKTLKDYENNELKNHLFMTGYRDDNTMNYSLEKADFCINLRFPNSEVCSLSLFEQMAFRKKIIAFRTGIYEEVPDDALIKIDVKNWHTELSEVLRKAGNQQFNDSIGLNAGEFVRSFCNVETYGRILVDFLRELPVYNKITSFQNGYLSHLLKEDFFADINIENDRIFKHNLIKNTGYVFSGGKNDNDRNYVLGIWAGFQYPVTDLRREGITRFMVYMADSMIRNYNIDVEVWSYSENTEELRESFAAIKYDWQYKKIKFINENNWREFFDENPDCLSFGEKINSTIDNLSVLVRDYSQADCFMPFITYLDNIIGCDKKILVPAHDMAVPYHYGDFVKEDVLYKARSRDIIARAKNLVRENALFFSNSDYVRRSQVLRYIDNLDEKDTAVVYLPVNVPENLDENLYSEDVIRKQFHLEGRYLIYPTQIRVYKNVSIIIKALEKLKDMYKDLKLVLTGDISDVHEVEALVEEFGIMDRIVMLRDISEAELYSLYKYAAAVPVTTLFEGGLPWQAFEALYMRAPLICTNIPVVKERIEFHGFDVSESGIYIVNPLDENEVAEGIRRAIENRQGFIEAQEAFRNKITGYTWDDAAKLYFKMIYGDEVCD